MIEEDRSFGFSLPEDRPLTDTEQREVWLQAMPEELRRGECPGLTAKDARHEATMRLQRSILERWGWILNRLDYDRMWINGRGTYVLPSFCRPGARRLAPKDIEQHRREQNR